MRMLAVLIVWVAALCAGFAAPASAAGRNDVFAVAGVRVDATAADASQARNAAFVSARRQAFDRLVRRLSTAEELQRLGVPRPDDVAIDRLVAGVDIEDERRSGTRYIARLGVNFGPQMVRPFLKGLGFQVLETRSPTVMVAPQLTGGAPGALELWRAAWAQGGYANDLAPIAVAPATLMGAADWNAAAGSAGQLGAATALYATARVSGGTVTADLVEVGPSGMRRERGQVSAPVSMEQGLGPALQRLADAANARIQAEWKQQLQAGAGARTRVAGVAQFGSEREWLRIRQGLASASGIIGELRIEAVAKSGALVSFSYVGTPDQLRAELGRTGVAIDGAGPTAVLRAAGG